MSKLEEFVKVFAEALEIDQSLVTDELKYNSIPKWDSIAHMTLIAALEDHYDIMLDTDDIIDMSSVNKAKEILSKYDVNLVYMPSKESIEIHGKDFSGQTVLITGATGGIGDAIATEFAIQGANLNLLGRNEEKLLQLKQKLLNEHNVDVEVAALDLNVEDEIERFFKQGSKQLKQLDVLVNCAGQMPVSALMMQKLSDVKSCLETNLFSTIAMSKYASRFMMRKKSGCIVNFSSILAEQGAAYQSVYAASKAGIEGFTKSIAKELSPMNIRVNAIAPGLVDTALLKNLDDEKLNERINDVPLGRMAHPSEIAQLCVFLASPKAGYMTGQVVSINGGLQL